MSDDTPTGETEPSLPPAEGPVEPSGAPEPSDASAASAPPDEPTATATAADATEATAAEPVNAESAAVPAAPPPNAPSERRGGILVPAWAAIVVAVLLIGGLGFAIGYWTGDDGGSDEANASSSQPAPNRQGPFSNGGGSNGSTVPNGNGNGQTTAQTAFLGVELANAANNGGASISSVRAGSPAADAGLKAGDVVTKIDDKAVANDNDLIRAIRAHKPGDEVTVTYTRDGSSAQVKVTLGDRSDATRSSVSP